MPTAMITGAARRARIGHRRRARADPHAVPRRAGRRRGSTRWPSGFGATTWPIDLADTDAIAAVVEPIVELDVLIHNAGVAYPGPRRRVDGRRVAQPPWRSMSLGRWRLR